MNKQQALLALSILCGLAANTCSDSWLGNTMAILWNAIGCVYAVGALMQFKKGQP